MLFLPLFTSACDPGPRTFVDVERGRFDLAAGEAEALGRLLASAGLASRELGIEGELNSTTGNWVEVDDDGHVWAIGLTGATDLDSLAPLVELPRLSRIRVEGARLDDLSDLSGLSALRHLNVTSSGLTSLAGLEGCSDLRVLDLPGNAILGLGGLADLPELRHLSLAQNSLEQATDLAGRQQLESLDLSDNQLTSAADLHDLPNLERLNLARNRLESLSGLAALPSLQELFVDDNRLTDANAIDGLPSLEIVNLNGNQLEDFPLRVSDLPQHLWQDNPGTLAYRTAELEERRRREKKGLVAPELPTGAELETAWSRGVCTWSGNRPRCDVRIPTVEGTGRVFLARFDLAAPTTDRRRHPPSVRLELEVGSGRVRAFLAREADGYPYAEAQPGEGAVRAGNLFISGQGVWFVLEAVDGEATDVRYRVEPEFGG